MGEQYESIVDWDAETLSRSIESLSTDKLITVISTLVNEYLIILVGEDITTKHVFYKEILWTTLGVT